MSGIEKVCDFIGKWIIIVFGVTVSLGAFTNMFEISASLLFVSIFTVLVSGILLAVSKMKHRKIVVIVFFLIMFLLIMFLRATLINGIYSVANSIIRAYNEYFGGNEIAFFDVREQGRFFKDISRYNILLLCITAIIYAYILVTATTYKLFASIHILLSMLFVIPGMILGKMPDSVYVAILMGYYLVCLMHQGNRRIYLPRMAGLAILCLWAVGMVYLLNPPSKYNAEELYRKYNEKLNKIADKLSLDNLSIKGLKSLFQEKETAMGGINGGKLGEVDQIKYSGDVMLRLTMQPDNHNLYLKGYVANEYAGNSWKDMSNHHAEIFNRFVLSEHPDIYLFTNNGSYLYADRMNSLLIRYENDPKDYRFFPYFCDVDSLYSASFSYDLSLKPKNENSYSYSYMSIGEDEYFKYFSFDENSDVIQELYYNISYDVPENIEDMFDELLVNPVYYDFTPDGLEKCVEYVKRYLSSNTKYSLNPGKLGKGEDYVVNFLTNKKEGYCTAYASAAVLMFRYLGVPARYVEGYIVTATDMAKSTPDETGYINLLVKDYSAHAWAEIYVPGLGFVPIEVTPGYSSSQSVNGGQTETSAATAPGETVTIERGTEEKTTEQQEITTTKKQYSSETVKEESEGSKNTSYVYIIIAVIVILSIFSLGLYKAAEKKKRQIDYKTQDLRHNIIVLSIMLKRYLNKLNIRCSKDVNLSEISDEINRRINNYNKLTEGKQTGKLALDMQDTLPVLEIIAKAEYCDEFTQITAEENDKVRQYVEEFKNSLQYLKNKV